MKKIPDFQSKSNNPGGKQSQLDLLERTKLSRLPERKPTTLEPPSFTKYANPACIGCGARVDRVNDFLRSINSCRKCIGVYTRVDAAIEESARRKNKELLEKIAAEVAR